MIVLLDDVGYRDSNCVSIDFFFFFMKCIWFQRRLQYATSRSLIITTVNIDDIKYWYLFNFNIISIFAALKGVVTWGNASNSGF